MSNEVQTQIEETVLGLIEHSPVGAVPRTPAYADALDRLYAAQKIYHSADHKDGHVTARSLASLPSFHAVNLADVVAGRTPDTALESNAAIFARYVASLPIALRPRAEAAKATVVGKKVLHRHKNADGSPVHDPVHTLFLVPGTGPNRGLPGNYLHGMLVEHGANAWSVHIHDSGDGAAVCDLGGLSDCALKLEELIGSAPFHLRELEALGFRML